MPRVARVLTRLLVVVLAALLGTPAAQAVAGSGPSGVWPLSPRPTVVRGFEPPSSTYSAGHRGIDLLGRPAQPVSAALAGTVTFAGQLAGRGVVVVEHGTTRTTYEPVAPSVRVGDAVAAGGRIGLLTSALSHCWPQTCLHLGWIRDADDVYLDPMGLFGARPVRLLPPAGGPPAAAPSRLPAPIVSLVRLLALASGAGVGLLVGPA